MTTISNKVFGGLIPRIPADKLPDDKAQTAVNCNFAYGELRPLKAPYLVTTLANAAKSVFSTDGLLFYSWPWRTKAWKGPVINDANKRMYFTDQTGGMRVAQTTGMQTTGGQPATSYKVGVPSVAAAPTYALADRTTYPDYPSVSIKIFYMYMLQGKEYGKTQVSSPTTVTALKQYTFNVPDPVYATDATTTTSTESGTSPTYTVATSTSPGAMTAGIPQNATLAVRIEITDSAHSQLIFALTTSVDTASAVSDGIPGGVEAVLTAGTHSGTNTPCTLTLRYGIIETRAYVVTMINQWSEESKPSPAVLVSPTYMHDVQITFTPATYTGYVPLTKYRLYRSTANADYIAVGSAAPLSGSPMTVTDSVVTIVETDATLGSIGWDIPPDNMVGLTLMPNGFFAGFVGDTLYFSEPYRPWAWPYSMSFPYNLVGMRAVESSLVVTTITYPYMVNGVHPSAMNQAQLTQSQAGITDHGMTVVGNTVSYVSNDGLVGITGYNVDLASGQAFWTRELWKAAFGNTPTDLELAYHDGSLVCSSSTAGKMWEIRMDSEGGGNLTYRDAADYADALYVIPASDQLYEIRGTSLYQHNGSSTSATYDWQGKDHIMVKPVSFTSGFINCTGSVTVKLYADGVQRMSQTFSSRSYFRIPSGQKALRWSIRLTGTGIVKEISIAERREELARV